MKRGALLFIFTFLLLISFASISAENLTQVENAYTCLKDKIEDRTCQSLSPEERFFSYLSVRHCGAEILEDSVNNECWPSNGCLVKSTAQAVLALNEADQNTEEAETWLLSQKKIPNELTWYIQADSNSQSSCTATYNSQPYPFTIEEDKKITAGSLGSCLSVSDNGYWMEISNSNQLGCYEEDFLISCDESFLTNLLFKKTGSSTINVAQGTSTAPSGGTTEEKINSFCLSTGSSCNYEQSLWATLALDLTGNDVSLYLPYLIVMKDENPQSLSESFLYAITSNTNYQVELFAKQKPSNDGKYWSESGDRFYDTAVALYPYQQQTLEEKTRSKEWLLSDGIQGESGCWQENIRNTAFLLYSIWPEYAPLGDDNNINNPPGNGTSGNETTLDCIDAGKDCRSSINCLDDFGSILSDYECAYPNVCCSVPPEEESCSADLGGIICDYDQECTNGIEEESQDLLYGETCCIGGTCEEETIPKYDGGDSEECGDFGGTCRSFNCLDDESETGLYSCSAGGICCIEGFESGTGNQSSLWIWILTILIIMVVIGIIFRDKLRRIFFGVKSRTGRPGSKPSYGGPRPPRRPMRPSSFMGGPNKKRPMPSRKPTSEPKLRSQKELDDVLSKLKKMGQ